MARWPFTQTEKMLLFFFFFLPSNCRAQREEKSLKCLSVRLDSFSKPASKPYTIIIIWLPTNNRALLSIKMCSKVSNPTLYHTQCSPSSSHQGFVSVRLESFPTRIHPIPSFSDHINRALFPATCPCRFGM